MDDYGDMDPMDDFENPDIGGHTSGDKGIPISEHTYTTPEGESATLVRRARGPDKDDVSGLHINLPLELEGVGGIPNDNPHVGINEEDL